MGEYIIKGRLQQDQVRDKTHPGQVSWGTVTDMEIQGAAETWHSYTKHIYYLWICITWRYTGLSNLHAKLPGTKLSGSLLIAAPELLSTIKWPEKLDQPDVGWRKPEQHMDAWKHLPSPSALEGNIHVGISISIYYTGEIEHCSDRTCFKQHKYLHTSLITHQSK